MSGTKKYSILCLGDSYTVGEAVSEQECFAMQAVELLRKNKIEFEQPVIIAKTGWTTDELSTAIQEKKRHTKFDFVTLLIGVNNQYRNRDLENYRYEFCELLNIAIDYTNGNKTHVFVLSIPDWGVTPFANNDKRGEKKIAEEIDLFNEVNYKETLQANVNYINITPFSRTAKTDAALIASDGLHPSGKMYAVWAQQLATQILQQIN
jgi:lysophospholipase L1-like esterase